MDIDVELRLNMERNKLIAKAFAIKKRLGLSDQIFTDLKVQFTGKDSIKNMDDIHLRAFVAGMNRLQPRQDQGRPAVSRRLSQQQSAKIIKLAIYVLLWSIDQLNGFLQRQTGKNNLQWLTAREAWEVTEALSAIIEREKDVAGYSKETRHCKKV